MKQNQLYRLILLLSIIGSFSIDLHSQECGFHPSDEFIERVKILAQQARTSNISVRPEATFTLGIKVYRLHKRSSGLDLTLQAVNEAIATNPDCLNRQFEPIGVSFEVCGNIIDVPNDDLAKMDASSYPSSWSNDETFIAQNYYDRAVINIYISDEIIDTDGRTALNGYTSHPQNNDNYNRIFYTKGAFFNKSTLPHEMGHFFGLLHTFGNNGNCNPNKPSTFNSSDTDNDDLVEDTPIDAGLDCLPSTPLSNFSYVDAFCNHHKSPAYANFTPSVNNFMNYASSRHCRTQFTAGQYALMRQFIAVRQNLNCSIVGSNCGDNYEGVTDNDTQGTANDFMGTLGNADADFIIKAKISRRNDADFFKVRFARTGLYQITMVSPPMNYNLFLYASYTTHNIPIDRSENSGNQAERIQFNVELTQFDYYVAVTGATSNDFDCNREYTLLIRWRPQELNNCYDSYENNNDINAPATTGFPSILINQSYSRTIRGNIHNASDLDYFAFTVPQGGNINVNLKSLISGYDVSLLKAGSTGFIGIPRIVSGTEKEVSFTQTQSGQATYIIKVSSLGVASSCDLYDLTLNWSPSTGSGNDNSSCGTPRDASYEPNETFSRAYQDPTMVFDMPKRVYLNGYLSSTTDKDLYKFVVSAAGQYGVVVKRPTNIPLTVKIYDATQTLVGIALPFTDDDYYLSPVWLLDAGIYYVEITSKNSEYSCTNDYRLKVECFSVSGGGGGSSNWTCSEAVEQTLVNGLCDTYSLNSGGCNFYKFGTTVNKPNRRENYPCEPSSNMTGGEALYKVNYAGSNICVNGLRIVLRDFTGNLDNFKIYLFNDCGLTNCVTPTDVSSNSDAGNFLSNAYFAIPQGTYYVMVDSKSGTSNFNISFQTIFTCPVVISVAPKTFDLRYLDFICSSNNQTYSVKLKVNTPILTSNYPFTSIDTSTFIIQNIPNGGVANITYMLDSLKSTTIGGYTCSCEGTLKPTNPQNAIFCNGGTAQISVNFPNTEGYEVRWYDTAVGGVILGRGTNFQTNRTGIYYAEAVQTATGCASRRVLVAVTSPNIPVAIVQKAITCKGGSDGALTATSLSNSAARYIYKWSTGQTTANIINLNMGTYTVTVTDSTNCSIILTERLADPQIFARITARDVNCTASNAQTLDAFAYSNGRNLQYRWSRGDTTGTLQNVAFGSYRLTVTDDRGCKTTDSIEVEDKSFYSIAYIENPTCKGRRDGKIGLSVLNGAYPYTFAWNNGKTTPSVDSLIAGRYVVAIQDAKGCRRTDTIDVSEPDSLKLFVNKANPTCLDSTNGKIAVYADGGNGLYAYQWNTQATSYNLSNLSAGTFNVQVKDRLNCLASTTIAIEKPDSISVNSTITPNPCTEQKKGEITLQVNGGKSPYKYVWQRGDTLARIVGLSAGSYNVTVVDSNKCVLKKAYQVNNLPPLESRITATGTKCSYTQDGILKIDTLIGFPPYQIGIDVRDNSTSRSFPNQRAGQHNLIIFDNYGCKWEKPFEIKQAPELNLAVATTNDDSLLKLGESTNISVKSSNYSLQTISWQPLTALACATCPTTAAMPFSTTTYKVKVKTTEGCEGTAEKQIKVSTERPVFAPTAFSPNGDNNNDYFTLFGPIGAKQVKTLKIFNRWGNMVFTKEFFLLNDVNLGWDGTYRGQAVDEGIYIYYAEVEFINGQIVKVQGDVSVVK